MGAPKGNDYWKRRNQPSKKNINEDMDRALALFFHKQPTDAIIIEDTMTQDEIDNDLRQKFPPGEAEAREREERERVEREDRENREREDRESRDRAEAEDREERERVEGEARAAEEKKSEEQRKRRINLSQLISASLVLAMIAHSLPLMYIGVRALLKKFMPEFTLRKLSKEGYEFLMFTEEELEHAGLEPLIEEVVQIYFAEMPPWLIAVLTLGFTASVKITMMHQEDDSSKFFTND